MLQLIPAPVGLVGLAGHLKRHPLPRPELERARVAEARAVWAQLRAAHGFRADGTVALLTPPDGNAKIRKGTRLVWSLTLSPAMASGSYNTCVRYADCADVCVLTAGKGELASVQRARDVRTALLYRAPEAFAILLADELQRAARTASKLGQDWGARLNAASDIPWEHAAPWLLDMVAELGGRAYDYSKAWGRVTPDSYPLTLSLDSRQSDDDVARVLEGGGNVAVVLPVRKGAPVPTSWHGFPTIDGDVTDARCDDPRGVVVVLRAKGKLRRIGTAHPLVRELV